MRGVAKTDFGPSGLPNWVDEVVPCRWESKMERQAEVLCRWWVDVYDLPAVIQTPVLCAQQSSPISDASHPQGVESSRVTECRWAQKWRVGDWEAQDTAIYASVSAQKEEDTSLVRLFFLFLLSFTLKLVPDMKSRKGSPPRHHDFWVQMNGLRLTPIRPPASARTENILSFPECSFSLAQNNVFYKESLQSQEASAAVCLWKGKTRLQALSSQF